MNKIKSTALDGLLLPSNIIIAPYCLQKEFQLKNYNKNMHFDVHCPDDRWFYVSKTGQMRTIIIDEPGIWTAVIEDNWPTGFLRRIR